MPLGATSGNIATLLVWAIVAAGLVGSATWIAHLVHLIRYRHLAVFLADLPLPDAAAGADDSAWASVAVIFAARDEAPGVEAATRSMLAEAEGDPSLRVIAVDDRSTDGTGAILDRLAATSPRLVVAHIRDLPSGWLGKTNALQIGAAAGAELGARWLLFTDADVVFQPGAVRRAVAYAEAEGVDQITVGPEVITRSVGERIFLSLFGLLFSLHGPIGRLGDRRSRAFVGVGAFNLVRAEAFEAVGGFRHLSLAVDDDMRLGQTLKYAGYSMRLLMGRGAVAVRWQVGTWGMVRGIEKNFFAGLKFRLARASLVAIGVVVLGIAPYAALLVGPIWSRIIAGLGIAAVMTMLFGAGRQSRVAWYYAWYLPAAAILILVALGRSVYSTLARRGIVWRNHHYPLTDLKKHIRHRDAWLAEVWRSTR